jgi:hypothetical protein
MVLATTVDDPTDKYNDVLEFPTLLVAVKVMLPELVAVGVPESSPDELNVSPVGSVPDVIDHVIVGDPVARN